MTTGQGQHHRDRLEGLDCLSALSRVQPGTSKKGGGYDAEMVVCVCVCVCVLGGHCTKWTGSVTYSKISRAVRSGLSQ